MNSTLLRPTPKSVIYERDGIEIARIQVVADTNEDAKIRSHNQFWPAQAEFDIFGDNDRLTIRVEAS